MKLEERVMDRQMAILSVSAFGNSVGADLIKIGHNVLLIDQ